ncbi:hypothetical protein TSAR_013038 [Trichomalopsis sarcophagae]|uniref:YqaJ viral recombinase domain-containing protein n=1 Tax=Trichomalopsis sarcophagae TaxID=543379 RepID=A0A232EQ38_9HYME|nr:hypothetical protein TSAR_013038 [Trichomalopsis sarcophagae]
MVIKDDKKDSEPIMNRLLACVVTSWTSLQAANGLQPDVAEYLQVKMFTVSKIGLDGVVVEDGCVKKAVEFKCLITCKENPIFDYQQKKCNVNYLYFVQDEVKLKESFLYYTQCEV